MHSYERVIFFNAQLINFLHLFCVFQVNLGKRDARNRIAPATHIDGRAQGVE